MDLWRAVAGCLQQCFQRGKGGAAVVFAVEQGKGGVALALLQLCGQRPGVFYHRATAAFFVAGGGLFAAARADADGEAVRRSVVAVGEGVNAAVFPPDGRAGEVIAAYGAAGVEVVEGEKAAVGVAEQALLAAVDGDARGEQRWQFFVEKAGEGFGVAAVAVITGQRRGVVSRVRCAKSSILPPG